MAESIHASIEYRERVVRGKHRELDALYEKYEWPNRTSDGVKLREDIRRLYDEILLLKLVVLDAQDKERQDNERTGEGVQDLPT